MRSFVIELAKLGGKIAREHYQAVTLDDSDRKGRGDYVTHVDHRIEDAISSRIQHHYPHHAVFGEETHQQGHPPPAGPCWIIDPIDGTTNFIRGLGNFAVSIAFCDRDGDPKVGCVYDPLRDEIFLAERLGGVHVNGERVYSSGCSQLQDALVASAMPFRHLEALDDSLAVFRSLQTQIDDSRRLGSAALDLAYVAAGRLDAYWELGIHCWDTAAGELLVRCAGGAASDYRGETGNLFERRSICAAASPALHQTLLAELAPLQKWLDDPLYRPHVAPANGG